MSTIVLNEVEESLGRLKDTIYDEVLRPNRNMEERAAIKDWILRKVDEFQRSIKVLADEEYQLVLMWFYIQMKAEWSQINTHNQYRLMLGYDIEMSFIYKANVLSATIKEIEKHINIYHVDGVTTFLSLPMEDFERSIRNF